MDSLQPLNLGCNTLVVLLCQNGLSFFLRSCRITIPSGYVFSVMIFQTQKKLRTIFSGDCFRTLLLGKLHPITGSVQFGLLVIKNPEIHHSKCRACFENLTLFDGRKNGWYYLAYSFSDGSKEVRSLDLVVQMNVIPTSPCFTRRCKNTVS